MQLEKIEDYFNSLPPVPYQVYRVSVGSGRIYYRMIEDSPRFYISLTTMTSATLPTSEFLIKWIADMGYDESRKYMNERADYGSVMHYAIGVFCKEKAFDIDKTEEFITFCKETGICKQVKPEWTDELKRDIAAFAQFAHDYNLVPLAIEMVLVSEDGYGTLIDMVCNMTITEKGLDHDNPYKSGKRKGEPREIKVKRKIKALINFKSGKHGFYDTHEIQLEFEKRLFTENYPDIKIDAIYNWSPKDWSGKPSYNLKDQTGSLNSEKADALLALAKIELMKKMVFNTTIEGPIKFGSTPKIKSRSLTEYIKERHQ